MSFFAWKGSNRSDSTEPAGHNLQDGLFQIASQACHILVQVSWQAISIIMKSLIFRSSLIAMPCHAMLYCTICNLKFYRMYTHPFFPPNLFTDIMYILRIYMLPFPNPSYLAVLVTAFNWKFLMENEKKLNFVQKVNNTHNVSYGGNNSVRNIAYSKCSGKDEDATSLPTCSVSKGTNSTVKSYTKYMKDREKDQDVIVLLPHRKRKTPFVKHKLSVRIISIYVKDHCPFVPLPLGSQ